MRWWAALGLVACKGGQMGIPGETDDPTPVPIAPACVEPADQAEAAFLERDVSIGADLPACERAWHAFAGASDSAVALTLDRFTGDSAKLVVTDLLGQVVAERGGMEPGMALTVPLDRSGELLVSVESDDPEQAVAYAVTASCAGGCERAYTRYPIVFVHGMAGTDSFLGLIDYWNGVVEPLEDAGYAVYVDAVDPFQPPEVRAVQWRDHLDQLRIDGFARRFNLVGHSQGGLDARYLAAHLDPDGSVASVTTIATPHHGSSVARVATGELTDLALTQLVLDGLFDSLAGFYGLDSDQDILAQVETLSPDGMSAFNDQVPDRPDVLYASWAGRSCQLVDVLCQLDNGGEIINPAMSATHLALQIFEGDNDGLVSVTSSMWGEFLGTLAADHLNEVGLGIPAIGFDPVGFYLDEAARLADHGL